MKIFVFALFWVVGNSNGPITGGVALVRGEDRSEVERRCNNLGREMSERMARLGRFDFECRDKTDQP